MSAVPAYSYPQPQRRPQRAPRPDVRAIPGGRRGQEQGVSSRALALARIAAIALVAFALICCVRVALSAATVTTAMETQQLNQQIAQVREKSNALEVTHSTLANPANVKTAAAGMGMVAPETTEYLDLGVDVVATDEAGNLSLTQSLERAGGLGA